MSKFVHVASVVALAVASTVQASEETNGPKGIDSIATGLSPG